MKNDERAVRGSRYTSNVIGPLTLAADVVCLTLSFPLAVLLLQPVFNASVPANVNIGTAAMMGIACLLIRQSQGIYVHPLDQLRSVDLIVVFDFALAGLLTFVFLFQFGLLGELLYALLLTYLVLSVVLLIFSRIMLHNWFVRLIRSGRIGQRAVIYGSDADLTGKAIAMFRRQLLPHLTLVGVADDRQRDRVEGDIPYLGGLAACIDLARTNQIDQIFIILRDVSSERLREIIEALSVVAVDVSVIPIEALTLSAGYRVHLVGDAPILTLWQRPMRDHNRLLKKAEDLTIALAATLVLAPLLVVTALAIKLTSPGPVLFTQKRFGFNNEEILIYKFRSMHVDRQDVSGARRTERNDDRVTGVGRFIRKLSIDELPQLWNVLKGQMSIVGPRPHAVHMMVGDRYYFDAVRGYSGRHRVKPGITGLAQVRGLRGEIQTIERANRRIELDTYYIDHWSLSFDIQIILETIVGVLWDRNAY